MLRALIIVLFVPLALPLAAQEQAEKEFRGPG